MATLEPKKNGAISIFAVAYIICTNLVGSGLGAACAAIIQPGTQYLFYSFIWTILNRPIWEIDVILIIFN